MLNYKNTLIISSVLLTFFFVIDLFNKVSPLIYICILAITVLLFVNGAISIKSGFYIKALCHAPAKKKSVALTFDDGPDENVTPLILKTLKKKGVYAAFFCIGKKVNTNPALVQRIHEEGHVIGGHSFYHGNFFDLYSSKRMEQEISDTEYEIEKIIGKRIKMFRPPYGVTNPNLARALKRKKCYVIGWSIRTNDTVVKDGSEIFSTVTRRLKGGDIILLHDTINHTADILHELIDYLRANGYNLERLDKLLDIDPYDQ